MSAPAARAKELFFELLELPKDESSSRLAALAEEDPELAERVDRLFAAHVWAEEVGTEGGGLRTPPPPLSGHQTGDLVAGYTLGEELGSGGFGTVWRALQTDPVRRDVALKLIRVGLESRDVVARFHAERQTLALMDHPSIARVYDGGSTQDGRPWFAMELVDGPPITTYCEERGLSTQERLELFHAVCLAVRHAHQKGVLHRDIKPTNVLVTEIDGRPVPKVIDFGISKLLGPGDADTTQLTRQGQLVGTPAYMSPEQVRGSLDIDTRADVYALGVLLYELLVGNTPFHSGDTATNDAPQLIEFQRRILEEEPRRPSTSLAELGGRRSTSTTTTGVAQRQVRGDLDWIVLCCLEKERDRRYGSAAALAADVERHLAHEPILAGPPSVGYRMAKLARRHSGLLAGVAAVFAVLVVGLAVSIAQARRARVAEAAATEAAKRATLELAQSQATAGFMEHVLLSLAPEQAGGRDTELLLHILDVASNNVDAWSEDLPVVEASIRRIVGGARLTIGEFEAAEPDLLRALELRESELGPDHIDTLRSRSELGSLYTGWEDMERALPHLELALQGLERANAVNALTGLDAELLWTTRGNLASTYRDVGRLDEALELFDALESHRTRVLGERHEDTLLTINNRALVLEHLGRTEEAVELYRQTLAIHLEDSGELHPYTLAAMNNLASALRDLDRWDEASELLERALDVKREVLPVGHPSLIVALNNVAQDRARAERFDAADELYAEAWEMSRESQGERGMRTLIVMLNWATAKLAAGQPEEAEALLREILDGFDPRPDPPNELVIRTELALAKALLQLERGTEAERYARLSIEGADRVMPPENTVHGNARLVLAEALALQGQQDAAEAAARDAGEHFRAQGRAELLARSDERLVEYLEGIGRGAEAERLSAALRGDAGD